MMIGFFKEQFADRSKHNIRCFYPIMVLTIVIGLFSMVTLHAQKNIHFDQITTDDGLSQSDINAIYQDDQGFMWFGTHDGLNKYDGYTFTVYKPDTENPKSINSNLIFNIAGDKSGNLWIGTTGNGLNYFDRETETFTQFRHKKGDEKSLRNDFVESIYLDTNSRLWIGTNDGLNMLDLKKPKEEREFNHYAMEHGVLPNSWSENRIYAIHSDSSGQLWIGGVNGLHRMTHDTNGDMYFHRMNTIMELPENLIVRSLLSDSRGRLIVGTSDGLYFQDGNGKLRKNGEGYFLCLLLDKDKNLWCGTNSGLQYFKNDIDAQSLRFEGNFMYDPRNPNSISKNVVKSLYLDDTGIIWIGTNGGGINKFDPERKQFRHIRKTSDPGSLSYDKIRSMFEDSNNTLWIGTEGGGLNMMRNKNDDSRYDNFVNFGDLVNPFAIAEVKRGNKKILMVGVQDSKGLYEIDITQPQSITKDKIAPVEGMKIIFTILNDSRDIVWLGGYGNGVHRWVPDESKDGYTKDTFRHNPNGVNSIPSDIIRNILEDRHGNVWFATSNGLCRLSARNVLKKNPVFEVFQHSPEDSTSLSHNYVLSLYESKAGTIWVGTFGGGLNQFVPSQDGQGGHFIAYSESDGLPNDVIKGILEDDTGHLWLSTNQGLSKFNPKDDTFINYDVNDGLQNSEFQELACLKRNNGEMLFGGINGFNAFYPEEIRDNAHAAKTMITSFSIFNQKVGIGEEINGRQLLEASINNTEHLELKHWENSFSFEFAALHYAAPKKNTFAYKLEGFDQDWIHTSSNKRFANYTNLPPGDYVFKVKASNNDGLWDETPSQIALNVIPPFWQTQWAYALYALLAVLLLLAFRKFTIIRTTEKHQLELQHLEKEQSEELQRIKLEFFTNISHEFRTPLTLIKGPLEYLRKSGQNISQSAVQEQYEIMHKNTSYLLRLVNQLLDFRKMNRGKMKLVVRNSNIVAFIKEVGEPFQFLAHKQELDFGIQSSNADLMAWFDHDALEKIMNNLLSNAFKFTPRGGKVDVEIQQEDAKVGPDGSVGQPMVLVKVSDSGSGIPKSSLGQIFERFYVEKDKNNKNLDGAGIGLSFTKNLVELHQGSISIESSPNKGTVFSVRLPIDKETYVGIPEISIKDETDSDFYLRSSEAESLAIGINDELADEGISKSRAKMPVLLLVDDNPDIRTFIKQVLADQFVIYEAENGEQGFRMAVKLIPNIIVSDIIMPVMDGLEFCEKVKTKRETSHIPVVMVTAKASQESELQGLQNGADDYIRKPFDMELLQLKLNNIMKRREEMRKRFNREITLKPQEVTVTSVDERFLKQAIEIVEKHMMDTDFNVEMLVKEMGHSRSNLYLKFKEITGLSSSEFIRNIRLKRAMQLLEQSDMSVKEIMYMTGFNTASYFSKCFKKQFGVLPSEYVRQMPSDKKVAEF